MLHFHSINFIKVLSDFETPLFLVEILLFKGFTVFSDLTRLTTLFETFDTLSEIDDIF